MFNILVLNCGSSSLKFQVIDMDGRKVLAKGLCERIGIDGSLTYENVRDGLAKVKTDLPLPDHKEAIKMTMNSLTDPAKGVLKSLDELSAVGHRIVHGGEKFTKSVMINDEVIAAIQEVSELAPLHNPANLAGIEACKAQIPNIPMVAVFDTAFHQTMPPRAYMYGIPLKYYNEMRIRRYGFHGTSHSYVSKAVAEHLGKKPEDLKTIVCHLGNGASISAVEYGKCIDTSMGFTTMAGLVMGTRCGDLDPGVMNYIMGKEHFDINRSSDILNKESGVLGLSGGLSSDFRDLWDARLSGNHDAEVALDVFIYNVAKYIGAYTAAMNGVDVICFTAGIGENDTRTRFAIMKYLGYLGITCDETANQVRGEITEISTKDSKVKVFVFPTNEELAIANETYDLVK
ncbi:MAG: acetate kinase [Lachnospiraceae bacterium]|nr:acetate kinase [Lachnospiraceae bacterium]